MKHTSFSEFVRQLNELFNEPINQGGSPNYPAGDLATSSETPSTTNITINKKSRRNGYVRSRR
jgi:hypothetical protein